MEKSVDKRAVKAVPQPTTNKLAATIENGNSNY
jgi:hypothetical protein